MGGHFKFHDFFLSIKADREKPYTIQPQTSAEDILKTKVGYLPGHIDLTPLKKASPFPLNMNRL